MTKKDDKAKLPAKPKADELVVVIQRKVENLVKQGELDLPPNYSAANALKAAWLQMQEVKDIRKQPALSVCTKISVSNALFRMVILGLNPAKEQCYFICRGKQMCMDRSYFGYKATALRVRPDIKDVYHRAIYENDVVNYEIVRGNIRNITHEQNFSNIDKKKITGSYCVAVDKNGDDLRSEIMTIDQIHQSWRRSKQKVFLDDGTVNPASNHGEFPDMMAGRTVATRMCRQIINQTDDSDRNIAKIVHASKEADAERSMQEADMIADEHENSGDVIDIEAEVTQQEELPAPDPTTKKQESDSLENESEEPPAAWGDEDDSFMEDEPKESKPPF